MMKWNEMRVVPQDEASQLESTTRCLIGLNGIKKREVAGVWEANVDLTVNYHPHPTHTSTGLET